MKIGFFYNHILLEVLILLVNLVNHLKSNSKIILFYNHNHPNIKNIKKIYKVIY